MRVINNIPTKQGNSSIKSAVYDQGQVTIEREGYVSNDSPTNQIFFSRYRVFTERKEGNCKNNTQPHHCLF